MTAAGRRLPVTPLALVAAAVAAVALVLLPSGASLGGGGEGVALNGLSRSAAWLVLLGTGLTWLAARACAEVIPTRAWVVAPLGLGLAAARMPVLLVGLLLVVALVVPRLVDLPASPGWSRTLVVGALASAATIAAAVVDRDHGDEVIAGLVVLGFLAAAGMLPFGWHMLRWLEQAPAGVSSLVVGCLTPGVVAALAASQPALTQLHAAQHAGWILGGFGGATAVVGGLYATGSSDWRTLGIRTVPAEVGLAIVGVAAFDIRGLQAAALTLTVMACTRCVLLFVDRIGPRRGAGLVATATALLGAAGLPPSLGFPARLLVLGAAVRVHPLVAVLVVTAMVVELAAIAAVMRRRLAQPVPDPHPGGTRKATALSSVAAVLLLAGGLFPGLLVGYVLNLAG